VERQQLEALMDAALEQARMALDHDDVPVGAVVADAMGQIVARDHNRREQLGDPTAHAEILAISAAAREIGGWRLSEHTLVVTLEPCPMCAGAAVLARIDTIAFGAADPKAGAAWSLFNIPQDRRLNHRCELVSGIRAEECSSLLREFFSQRRPE
jgi:tRNA(adenine34) deaminase